MTTSETKAESLKSIPTQPNAWWHYAAEFIGTAFLLAGGLSLVILLEGTGSPLLSAIPIPGLRRLLTGFLFGAWASLIVVSPVGKISGAHLNPAVTFAFWLMGKISPRLAGGYVVAQLAGAAVGSLPLLAWGSIGKSVAYGATFPGAGYSIHMALLGEAMATFGLIMGLCVFIGFRHLRPLVPLMIPCLYAVMVYFEAPISGTSTNPARSLGPSMISGQWQGAWIYWAGPFLGTLVATLTCSFLAKRITAARLYYFDNDRDLLLRRK